MPRQRTALTVVESAPPVPVPVQAQEHVASAIFNAMKQPEFIAALEREARLQPLAFLSVASKFLGGQRNQSPAVTLNNIITSIPRSPLDELPEGFNLR